MQEGILLRKIRDFIERFYPDEPISIVFSKGGLSLLVLLGLLAGGYLYLRAMNIDELELLQKKHTELQTIVKSYLDDMSRVKIEDAIKDRRLDRLEMYKKQLNSIEEEIKSIKKFWFIE